MISLCKAASVAQAGVNCLHPQLRQWNEATLHGFSDKGISGNRQSLRVSLLEVVVRTRGARPGSVAVTREVDEIVSATEAAMLLVEQVALGWESSPMGSRTRGRRVLSKSNFLCMSPPHALVRIHGGGWGTAGGRCGASFRRCSAEKPWKCYAVGADRCVVMGMGGEESGDGPEVEGGTPERRKVALSRWQLLRLADAAAKGRRHINVKVLAGELQLDRRDVLAWLKNPPDLSQLGLDVPAGAPAGRGKPGGSGSQGSNGVQQAMPNGRGGRPDWNTGKRLRKDQVATLERVYASSKYPNKEMMESLLQMTHIPRRKILQWFQERREASYDQQSSPSQTTVMNSNEFAIVREEDDVQKSL